MELRFTQEYFLKVVPEWYAPGILSGVGTLEKQICEYEQTRARHDGTYFLNLKPGNTTVEIVKEVEDLNEKEASQSNSQEPED